MLSRSGETDIPSTSRSSPTLPTIVRFAPPAASTRPRAKRAPPTPPGEEHDLHGCRARPIAACVLGPARRPTGRRSSSVSTSSLEIRDRAGDRRHADAVGVVAEAGGAAAAVERREVLLRGQRQRVRRPVLGLDVADRTELGRAGERAQIVGDDAGQVGVDDQHDAFAEPLERGRHRRSLTAGRVRDRLGSELGCQRAARLVVGDDERAAGHGRRREHVAEHRQGELRAGLVGRVEPLLAVLAAVGDHDLRHRARL